MYCVNSWLLPSVTDSSCRAVPRGFSMLWIVEA